MSDKHQFVADLSGTFSDTNDKLKFVEQRFYFIETETGGLVWMALITRPGNKPR